MRRVYFTGPNGEIIEARLVYDYGTPDAAIITTCLKLVIPFQWVKISSESYLSNLPKKFLGHAMEGPIVTIRVVWTSDVKSVRRIGYI